MILFFIIFAFISEAFFAGSETAFISINFMKLTHLIEKKNKKAMIVHKLLKKPDRLLATTLVGTNLSVVASSVLMTALFSKVFPVYAALLTIVVVTPVSFIFCELLPKTVFRYRASRIVLSIAPFLDFAEKIFFPLTFFISSFAQSVARMINPKGMKRNPFLTKDEIKSLVKDISKEGILEEHEKDAIDQIFEFKLTKAKDIMVPLHNVISVDVSESLLSVREKGCRYGFTRFPVFDGKDLKGVLNIFDVFYSSNVWQTLIRPIIEIDSDESVDKVFARMQPIKQPMAAVFSGRQVVGVLTMEDLIEDIALKLTLRKKE